MTQGRKLKGQQLQRLRARFTNWSPWLSGALRSKIAIVDRDDGFAVVVSWGKGNVHVKEYTQATLAGSRVRCLRDYARILMQEVLKKRGIIDEQGKITG